MPVTLTDTTALQELLASRAKPSERLRRARGPVMELMQARLPPLMGAKGCPALFQVQQAARLDGYEVVAMQQGWGLFNPTRSVEASVWAMDQLSAAVTREAAEALATSLGELSVDADVELLVVPADSSNRNLMVRAHGLSVCAVAPGWVLVQIWPSAGNLARLPANLARAAAHQAWANQLEPVDRPVMLAEALAIEAQGLRLAAQQGLCDASEEGAQLLGPPSDHDATLRAIAAFHDLDDYDDLDTNIYGGIDRGGASRVPRFEPPTTLSRDEHDYTLEAIATERDTTDPVRIAACLYGDLAVTVWGHAGGGYAPLAGLDAAVRSR